MDKISGIGRKGRIMLGKVLSQCRSKLITPADVTDILQLSSRQAGRLLQYWKKNGWLFRIRRGLYQSLPIKAESVFSSIEDAWVVADKLFAPCYIAGWSAIEFWGLTEQIFNSVVIVTSRNFSKREYEVDGIKYILKKILKISFLV
jgi:predicted transcriptional regulator of viral defense system